MHTSGGAACGRDDDGGDAPELCMCRSLPRTKIKEYSRPVNGRITSARSILGLSCRCNSRISSGVRPRQTYDWAVPPRRTSATYSQSIGLCGELKVKVTKTRVPL